MQTSWFTAFSSLKYACFRQRSTTKLFTPLGHKQTSKEKHDCLAISNGRQNETEDSICFPQCIPMWYSIWTCETIQSFITTHWIVFLLKQYFWLLGLMVILKLTNISSSLRPEFCPQWTKRPHSSDGKDENMPWPKANIVMISLTS